MSDHTFQDAYVRVRARYDDRSWFSLSPRQITDAIYQEIRALDRERLIQEAKACSLMAIAAE
jgi:hypothetical protein